jgi:predicted ATPase/DNA-binding SARP family transcriptional activator
MAAYRLFLFGSPRLEREGEPLRLHGRKAVALAAYLAVTAQPQRRDYLATFFWPEFDQTTARANLRRELAQLRRVLGEPLIEVAGDEVCLRPGPAFWVDVAVFAAALAPCRHPAHAEQTVCPACLPLLQSAADLYSADFLAGFTLSDCPAFDEWQFFQAEGYRHALATVLERLVPALQQASDSSAAIAAARRRVSLDPLHEPAQRQLIALYAATGNLSAALRQYELCSQLLQTELGVSPAPETVALGRQLRQGGTAPPSQRVASQPAPLSARLHTLPAPVTPLIGRTDEVAEVTRFCRDPTTRLMTILGPGGMGKTHLALAVAQSQVEHFAHGVCWVALAPLTSAEELTPAIAEAVGLQFQSEGRPPKQQLLEYLRHKQLLLLLDNFEHLLAGVDLVHELLQAGLQLKLLVTTRERLRLTSETVFTLGTLDYPTWAINKAPAMYSAVELFVQTARRNRPDFQLSTLNEAAVIRICQLVGGMPLGVILAAAWVELLTPAEIAEELAQGIEWLVTELHDLPARQQSLTAVLAYSWQRLTAEEQAVVRRLAIFRGGFTRAAAHAVAGAALPMLARLVDKSFVQRVADGRYDLHEVVRHFASKQGEPGAPADGELAQTRSAHCHYFANRLHQLEPDFQNQRQVAAYAELRQELPNLLIAWQQAITAESGAVVDHFVESLTNYYAVQGSYALGLAFTTQAIARLRQEPAHDPQTQQALVKALVRHCIFLAALGQVTPLTELLQEAHQLAKQADDPQQIIEVLGWLAQLARRRQAFAEMRSLAEEALTLAQNHNFWHLEARMYLYLGAAASGLGDKAAALTLYERSLQLYQVHEHYFYIDLVSGALAILLKEMGEFRAAQARLQDALDAQARIGSRHRRYDLEYELGVVAQALGEYADARTYYATSLATSIETGIDYFQPSPLLGLATLARLEGDYPASARYLQRCLQLLAIHPQPDMLAEAHYQQELLALAQAQ